MAPKEKGLDEKMRSKSAAKAKVLAKVRDKWRIQAIKADSVEGNMLAYQLS